MSSLRASVSGILTNNATGLDIATSDMGISKRYLTISGVGRRGPRLVPLEVVPVRAPIDPLRVLDLPDEAAGLPERDVVRHAEFAATLARLPQPPREVGLA